MTTSAAIVYEQPVNEHIRVCLRLEHLLTQAHYGLQGSHSWESRTALAAMMEILNVLDRPDLKAKLVKELARYASVIARFAETPHIDHNRLAAVQADIEHALHPLHNTQGRLAQDLRDNDFLTSIRQYLLNPGGGCSFEVPAYHYWLQQPPHERIQQLTHWFSSLRPIQTAVATTLRLVRQASPTHPRVAQEGFYQAPLDAQAACQLIRVTVPHDAPAYPEISVGRHGISIRFYQLSLTERPQQLRQDVKFYLACCVF